MIRKALFLATMAVSLSAPAATLSYYGYTLDTDTHIVTGNGLQWLQWSQTTTMPIKTALQTYQAAGWRVATGAEMSNLLYSFQFYPCPSCTYYHFDTDETTEQDISLDFYESGSFNVNRFITLFGDSIVSPSEPQFDVQRAVGAVFGSDPDGDLKYEYTLVRDHYKFWYTERWSETEWMTPIEMYRSAEVRVENEYYNNFDYGLYGYGIALVREVPIPPAGLLFASAGLPALLAGVRKKLRARR